LAQGPKTRIFLDIFALICMPMENSTSDAIKVQLQSIGGRELELEVDSQMTVLELKKKVQEKWTVGVNHQRLVFGMQEPLDLESLRSVASHMGHMEGPLAGYVLMTQKAMDVDRRKNLDAIVEKLCSEKSWVRSNAVCDLAKSVDVCDGELDYVILSIRRLVVKEGDSSKRSCLEALAKMSPQGNLLAIDAAALCLVCRAELVRLFAVETLAQLVVRGHEATRWKMQYLLRSRQNGTKIAALLVLGEVVNKDDANGFALISKYTEDADADIRMAASEAVTAMLR